MGAVAVDPSWHPRALLPFGALWWRIGSLHGWKKEEEEKIAGYSRQPACARPCGGAYRRGAAGVIAYSPTVVGANGRAHDGRKRRSDDVDSYSYSSVRNASDDYNAN